ncbi:MAG TPA: hypothetical protein VKH65_12440, partial [Myxococcales bacterium]|nr:hypothetical protein [Myxococcales bacterium]
SSATLIQEGPCRGHLCTCERLVRGALESDLWRLADIGRFKRVQLGEASPVRGAARAARVDGLIDGEDGQAKVSAACISRDPAPVTLVVLQPPGGSSTLIERMAATVSWPGKR